MCEIWAFFFSHTCANKAEFWKFKSGSTGVVVEVEAVEVAVQGAEAGRA